MQLGKYFDGIKGDREEHGRHECASTDSVRRRKQSGLVTLRISVVRPRFLSSDRSYSVSLLLVAPTLTPFYDFFFSFLSFPSPAACPALDIIKEQLGRAKYQRKKVDGGKKVAAERASQAS